MFWRMITRALQRQRGRRALIAVTVALGVALSTAILSVMLDVGDKVNAELQTYGANITLRPKNAALVSDLYGGASSATLKEADLAKIKTVFWANNIVDFAPFLQTEVSLGAGDTEHRVQAVGTWFGHSLRLPSGQQETVGAQPLRSWWDVTGHWAGPDSAMVGSTLAAAEGIHPGSTIHLHGPGGSVAVPVAGVFDSGDDADSQVYVPLAALQRITGHRGEVGWVEVSALTTPDNDLARRAARDPDSLSQGDWETWYCTAYVSSISYQLEQVVTGSVAKPVRQVAESQGAVLQKTQLLMLLVTGLSLVAAALGIANLVSVSVMERAPEVGLLKALGATDRAVVTQFLTETVLVGLVGGAVGYGAGLGLAQVIGTVAFGSTIAVHPALIPLIVVFVLAVIALGSLPAIRLLLSLRPAEVLHGR